MDLQTVAGCELPLLWARHAHRLAGGSSPDRWSLEEGPDQDAFVRLWWDRWFDGAHPMARWPVNRGPTGSGGGFEHQVAQGRPPDEVRAALAGMALLDGNPDAVARDRRPLSRAEQRQWQLVRRDLRPWALGASLCRRELDAAGDRLAALLGTGGVRVRPYRSASLHGGPLTELPPGTPAGVESLADVTMAMPHPQELFTAENHGFVRRCVAGVAEVLSLDALAGLEALITCERVPSALRADLEALRSGLDGGPLANGLRIPEDDPWQRWMDALVSVLHRAAPALILRRWPDEAPIPLAASRELIARGTGFWERVRALPGCDAGCWLGGGREESGTTVPRTPFVIEAERAPGLAVVVSARWRRGDLSWPRRPRSRLTVEQACRAGLDHRWAWSEAGREDHNEHKVSVSRLRARVEGGAVRVDLECQVSTYADYVCSHLAVAKASPHFPAVRALLEQLPDADGRLAPLDGVRGGWRFESHLGVSAAVVTRDGWLPLARQKIAAAASGGLLVPAASGSSRVACDDKARLLQGAPLSVQADMERELNEELRRGSAGPPVHLEWLAVVRDALRGGKPELFCAAHLDDDLLGLHADPAELDGPDRGGTSGVVAFALLPAATLRDERAPRGVRLRRDWRPRLAWIEAFLGTGGDPPELQGIGHDQRSRLRSTLEEHGGQARALRRSPFVDGVLHAYRQHVLALASGA